MGTRTFASLNGLEKPAVPFAPASAKDTVADIVDQLKRAITSGRYAAGDKLPSERALQKAFAVGRGSVRRALQQLRQKDWLECRRGAQGGEYVRNDAINLIHQHMFSMLFQADITMEKLVEFRSAIDDALFSLFIMHADDADAAELREKCKAMDALVAHKPTDFAAVAKLDFQLYRKCVQVTKNPLMLWLYDNMYTALGYQDVLLHCDDKHLSSLGTGWTEYVEALISRNLAHYRYLCYENYKLLFEQIADRLPQSVKTVV